MTPKRSEYREYGFNRIHYTNGLDESSRENGPAGIYGDGTEYWYKNGELFREDGPCIIYPDGSTVWHLVSGSSGFYTEDDHGNKHNWSSAEKLYDTGS